MSMRMLASSVACLVLASPPLRAAESEEARAVKARFAATAARVKALDVSYKLEATSEIPPDRLIKIPEYRNQVFLPRDEWREAFSGEKRYRRQVQPAQVESFVPVDENGLIPPPEPSPDDPAIVRANQKLIRDEYDRAVRSYKAAQARLAATKPRSKGRVLALEPEIVRGFNGRTLWQRKPGGPGQADAYIVWPARQSANWFQAVGYASRIGLDVPDPSGDPTLRKTQADFQLAGRVQNPSYELEPNTEVVDGATCAILVGSIESPLKPGERIVDRIWLDRDHGYLPRRRESARAGRIILRSTSTDLKEVAPALWLPQSVRTENYPADPVPGLDGKAAYVETIRVQSLALDAPDALFDMSPRPGDRVDDLRGQ